MSGGGVCEGDMTPRRRREFSPTLRSFAFIAAETDSEYMHFSVWFVIGQSGTGSPIRSIERSNATLPLVS